MPPEAGNVGYRLSGPDQKSKAPKTLKSWRLLDRDYCW
jgi:hypothetical protein